MVTLVAPGGGDAHVSPVLRGGRMRHPVVAIPILLFCLCGILRAQCPDGTPPPCAAERRARQEALRRAAAAAPDSSTALVVPLTPIGTDSALRRLGADFAAIVADNMTVGEVHARVADNLGRMAAAERPRAAARQRAGAVVDGTITRAGAVTRATVRLVDAHTARTLATATVQGDPDSLLSLADRASVVLLKTWWKAQPGPHARDGLTTSSLPVLRHYVAAMTAWRRGDSVWVALLDSAARRDPGFVAAWQWLGLPRAPTSVTLGWEASDEASGEDLPGEQTAPLEHISPDSARHAFAYQMRHLPEQSQQEGQELADHSLLSLFEPGGGQPPTRRNPVPFLCGWGQPLGTTVEERYMGALALRAAALLGCPDTMVVRAARSAYELDPAFTPAWGLLFDEQIRVGDTAGARRTLDRYPGADTVGQKRRGDYVRVRLGPPAIAAAADTEGWAGLLFIAWHRFREAAPFAATLRRNMTADLGPLGERFTAAFRATLELPIMVALGQYDSARAVAQAAAAGLMPDGGPHQELSAFGALPWFPPDTALVREVPDTPWLDSLDQRLRSLSVRVNRERLSPEAARLALAGARRKLLHAAWFSGALAIQRGDLVTGRRAAELLGSARDVDSVLSDPLRNGLRAELALAADSGAAAESLLVETIAGGSPWPPARYLWLLARRYADAGQPGLALRLARSITMPLSLSSAGWDLVRDHACVYVPALLLEGEVLERLGLREEALARYQEYVELRAGADAQLQPEVAEVRARIARLAGSGHDDD